MINSNSQRPLTLSREDLYELVWSKPMQELAKDFGISDVALAKRCRRLRIPVPGRGYWARVEAGQMPHRPKLPERELPENLVEVPDTVNAWDPVIRAHRGRLEADAKEMRASKRASERYEKLPAARRRFEFNNQTWKWDSHKDRGQRLCDTHKPTAYRVSLGTYERALRITNTIAIAAKCRGFALRDEC